MWSFPSIALELVLIFFQLPSSSFGDLVAGGCKNRLSVLTINGMPAKPVLETERLVIADPNIANWESNHELRFFFFLPKGSKSLPVGQVQVYRVSKPDSSTTADIGMISIEPQYRKQGYAEEAERAVIQYAFEKLGV